MTEKLRRCPFCGGVAEVWDNKLERRLYGVICKECDCMTPYFESEVEAITAWNRRIPMDKMVKQLEEKKNLCNEIATEAIEEMNDLQLQVGARNQAVAFEEAIEISKGFYEEIYSEEYDTAGNYHFWSTQSGHTVIRK